MRVRTTEEIVAGLDTIRQAPAEEGVVRLIARRPLQGEREVLDSAELSTEVGLVGDNWLERGSRHTEDGSAETARQLTLMSSRAIELFAGRPEQWPLAGDQLYVDFDLSIDALPAGTCLAIGDAVIEVSEEPHTGCAKFRDRFGIDASRFLNTDVGIQLRLRGLNARVVQSGTVRVGDRIRRVAVSDGRAGVREPEVLEL